MQCSGHRHHTGQLQGPHRLQLRAVDKRWRNSAPRAHGRSRSYSTFGGHHSHIGVPITFDMEKLPEEGQFLTEYDQTCDPNERNCKTPMVVYEAKCKKCFGSGLTVMRGRKRGVSTCAVCTGIGYLRFVSTRGEPGYDGEDVEPLTMFRKDMSVKEPTTVPQEQKKKKGFWSKS